MSRGKSNLENAIKIINDKKTNIDIKYEKLDNYFYHLKISFNTDDGGKRNYIFSYALYSELDNCQTTEIVNRILDIVKFGWAF